MNQWEYIVAPGNEVLVWYRLYREKYFDEKERNSKMRSKIQLTKSVRKSALKKSKKGAK